MKNRRSADQQLPIRGQLQFDIRHGHTDGAHAVGEWSIQGDHRRGFREPVALPQGDAHRGEPLRCVDAQRRAADHENPHPAAKSFPHLAVDQLAGELPQGRPRPATVVDRVTVPGAERHCPGQHAAFDRRERRLPLHFLANFLEHAGHTHKHRGPNILHGLGQLVELRAIGHLRAAGVHHVIQGPGGDVRQRQEGDAGVGRGEAEIRSGDALVRGDVAVREHDALGLAGGSGGVNQRGQVLGLDGTHQRVKDGVPLAAQRVGPGNRVLESDGPFRRCRRVHDHNPLQRSEITNGVQLVELLAG